jgi:hypothetical protein
MTVFISYSHQNSAFVDRLALRLAEEQVHVWVDRWELRVGDSLTQKIEGAMQRAKAVLVVLSQASVASEWCRRELNAGLVRELEEHRVVVLPLLIEDCDVPLFLRDKLRGDFRSDFERGVSDVLAAIAPVTNVHRARIEEPEFLIDWAIDYFEGEFFYRRLTLVEHSEDRPYIAITELEIEGNVQATAFHQDYVVAGVEWWSDRLIIEALAESIPKDLRVVLDDHMAKSLHLAFEDGKYGARYEVKLTSRLLGTDTGGGVLLHIGNQLLMVLDEQRSASRDLTTEEVRKVEAIRARRGG